LLTGCVEADQNSGFSLHAASAHIISYRLNDAQKFTENILNSVKPENNNVLICVPAKETFRAKYQLKLKPFT